MKNYKIKVVLYFQIMIILAVALGLLVPRILLDRYVTISQAVLIYLFCNFCIFLILRIINKYLVKISKVSEKIIKNLQAGVDERPYTPNIFSSIDRLTDNLKYILEHFKQYLTTQKQLVYKYTNLNKELEKSNELRDSILDLSQSIIEVNDADQFFKLLLEKAINSIDGAEKGSLLVLDKEGKLEYKAAIGFDLNHLSRIKLDIEGTFLWNHGNGNIKRPCIIRNVKNFNKEHLDSQKYVSLKSVDALNIETVLSSPIIINDQLYGMLNIDSLDRDAFNDEDIALMEYFANQAGIAIKNHKLIEKITYLSRFDCLTNIYNRRYFEELFFDFFKKAKRYREKFSLVIMDLDKFKQINDTFGHAIGDRAIQNFARVMASNIRASDLFARYGGDEFICVFFNASEEDAKNKMGLLVEKLNNNPMSVGDRILDISFSFGIASFPQDAIDMATLFKMADKRMYRNKGNELISINEDYCS